MRTFAVLFALALLTPALSLAQSSPPGAMAAAIDRTTAEILPQVVTWRRDFHRHPELGLQETRTAKVIADHLRTLGMELQTGIAGTGVVGILKGATPGKVVALRSDMDGLPVTEQVDLPFKSTERAMWDGQEVGVMHACGHDNHMAILLGAATVLARMRNEPPGTVKFIFQPGEEGPGGAEPMVKAGVLEYPKVDAVFGLHAFPFTAGAIVYRSGPVHDRDQVRGGRPCDGDRRLRSGLPGDAQRPRADRAHGAHARCQSACARSRALRWTT